MRTNSWFGYVLVFGFLLVLTLLVLVPASPLVQKLPSWDSGIFLYTGWRITLGDLLYRDVWDHKPPLIYFINALGVWLGSGSRWGVWTLEFVSLLTAGLLGFGLVRRAFGVLPAVYASVAWMVNAFVTMDGGNYTTEYALPLQFGLLWVVGTAPESGISARRGFLIGVLSGLLFWLRQNDIGLPLAIVLLLALDFLRGDRRRVLRTFAGIVSGAILVSVLVILPMLVQGTLSDFWEAAFRFNFEYIDESWFKRFASLRFLPITLPALGLVTLAFAGWLIAVLAFVNGIRSPGSVWTKWSDTLERLLGVRRDSTPRFLTQVQVVRLLTLAVIALPIECFLVSLSGEGFDHYFLALLPVLAVLGAFTFCIFVAALERAGLTKWARAAFVAALLLVLLGLSAEYVRPIFYRVAGRDNGALVAYILAKTDPRDRVQIWAGEARVNFLTKRASSMRFVHTGLLSNASPTVQTRLRQAMNDLMRDKPRWIIQKDDTDLLFSQFSSAEPEITDASVKFLQDYRMTETVDEWTIYERRSPQDTPTR